MLKDQGMEAIILSTPIDKPFVSYLEYAEKDTAKFLRVDSDISENLKDTSIEESEETKKSNELLETELQNLFKAVLNDEKN